MGELTRGDVRSAVTMVAAGIFVVRLYRKLQQSSRCAVNPDVPDPGPKFRILAHLLLGAVAVALVVLAITVGDTVDGLGLVGAVVLLVATAVGYAAGAVWIWARSIQRQQAVGYVICEAQYVRAPRRVKSSMRRIYRSADAIRSSRAYRDGMLDGLDLDHLVFGAAERALVSAELAEAIASFGIRDVKSEDKAALVAASANLKDLQTQLGDVEKTLERGSKKADRLSQRLTQPERERAADRQENIAAQRRGRARARLDDITARAAIDPAYDAAAVEERIDALEAGYEEVVDLSGGVLGPTRPSRGPKKHKKPTRDEVIDGARATAARATKLSVSTVRTGAARLKSRKSNGS